MIKVSLIVLMGLAAVALLRRQSAAAPALGAGGRHRVRGGDAAAGAGRAVVAHADSTPRGSADRSSH